MGGGKREGIAKWKKYFSFGVCISLVVALFVVRERERGLLNFLIHLEGKCVENKRLFVGFLKCCVKQREKLRNGC